MMSLGVFVSLFFLYSLISRRLEQTVVTAPIVFTVAGMLMFPALPAILKFGVNAGVLSWRTARGGWQNRSNKSAWSRCRCFA